MANKHIHRIEWPTGGFYCDETNGEHVVVSEPYLYARCVECRSIVKVSFVGGCNGNASDTRA